jgi:hypothetical protein
VEILQIIQEYHLAKNYRGLLSKINKNPLLKSSLLSLFESRFSFNVSLSEGIYLIINTLYEKPKCSVCSNAVKFKNPSLGYLRTCSNTCAQLDKKTIELRKTTSLKKYGVDHYTKTDEYKKLLAERINSHNFGFSCDGYKNYLLKNNVSNVSQIPHVKQLIKETVKNRSYEENLMILNKIKATLFSKYGVINGFELATRFLYKEFILPSGTVIKLQGYEDVGLKELLNTYNEMDIIYDRKKVPVILYDIDTIKKRYYTDFWIPSANLIIEIKSKWTYNVNKDITHAKLKAATTYGYNAELWICDKTSIKEKHVF